MNRKLVLVRHGQSLWNRENRFTGLNDVGLSEQGIAEANQASERLINNDIIIATAFTSTLQRAKKTAQIILDAQKHNHMLTTYNKPAIYNLNDCVDNSYEEVPFYENAALNERDYGDLSGKNKAETVEEYGIAQVHEWRRSYNTAPPGGESLRDVVARVGAYFHNWIFPCLNDGNVLVAAHGNSLRALLVVLELFSETEISKVEIPTGKPLIIEFKGDPLKIISELTHCLSPIRFRGREILDSRGNPTLEVDVYHGKQMLARESAPSGASTGTNEAHELRDGGDRYRGKGVVQAVKNVNRFSAFHYLTPEDIQDQDKFDNELCRWDGTLTKKDVGGNTTTALSFAGASAGAKIGGMPLFKYIRGFSNIKHQKESDYTLPTPMVNILNGGKHAGGNLKIQEFMILPNSDISFREKLRTVTEVYHTLGKLLVEKYGQSAKNLGDEGGFAPQLNTAEEALSIIEEAVQVAGYSMGKDIFLALDCAASEFYDGKRERYEVESGIFLDRYELCDYYKNLIVAHPGLRSIEDPFDEYDYEAWNVFVTEVTPNLPNKIMVVGDDLFTTNPETVRKGLKDQWANSLLLKVNQIGTVTEAIQAANMLFERNMDVIVSHRSGETTGTFIADLAVGIGAKYIKTGAPARGERVAKYNRLLQIEELIEFM